MRYYTGYFIAYTLVQYVTYYENQQIGAQNYRSWLKLSYKLNYEIYVLTKLEIRILN